MQALKRKNFGTKLLSVEDVREMKEKEKRMEKIAKRQEKRRKREKKEKAKREKAVNEEVQQIMAMIKENVNHQFAVRQRQREEELFGQFSLNHTEPCWGTIHPLDKCTHCCCNDTPFSRRSSSTVYFGILASDVKEAARRAAGRQEFLRYQRQPDGGYLLVQREANFAPEFDS